LPDLCLFLLTQCVKSLTPQLTFLIEYLNLPDAVGDPDANWETFQLQHINNPSLLAIELKSRQVGWSWLAAVESIACCHLVPRTPCIFLSINQEEANEKIRYTKQIYEALDKTARVRIIRENKSEIEFANGSRIISHPCRPLRGKAKARVYLDEFAHYPNAGEIYQSVLPVLSKGGSLRIGSSPLGARGRFWEIYTQAMQKYPGYVRASIPWWSINAFCRNTTLAKAIAPSMATRDRVMQFGTSRIIQIFENSLLDDFQQEYECAWLDETVSWIDWELIKRNQALALEERLFYRKADTIADAYLAIKDLAEQIGNNVEDVMVAGMDVGRRKDRSEIVVLGKSNLGLLPFRLNLSLNHVEFDQQQKITEYMLDTLPIRMLFVDETGMGMNLAENLNTLYGNERVKGITFSGQVKQDLAVEAKLKCQRAEVPLPLERDLTYQIHSVKRKVSDSSNIAFENDRSDPHHADKFWAWVLAIAASKQEYTLVDYNSPLYGYRG
jgi:phage FluMu gp28-like protein